MSAVLCFTCVLIFIYWLFVNFVSVNKDYASSVLYGSITFILCPTSLILLSVLAVVSRDSPFNLAALLLTSARKFIRATYAKASFSRPVAIIGSFSFYLIHYFVRKMSVAAPQRMLSTKPPKYLRGLPGVTQNLCSSTQHVVLENFIFYPIDTIPSSQKFRYKNDRLSNVFTSTSESLSTSVWFNTAFEQVDV